MQLEGSIVRLPSLATAMYTPQSQLSLLSWCCCRGDACNAVALASVRDTRLTNSSPCSGVGACPIQLALQTPLVMRCAGAATDTAETRTKIRSLSEAIRPSANDRTDVVGMPDSVGRVGNM